MLGGVRRSSKDSSARVEGSDSSARVEDDVRPGTLLDFERCAEAARPSNVTGAAQYLSQAWAAARLAAAGVTVDVEATRAACRAYKASGLSEAAFAGVLEGLGL